MKNFVFLSLALLLWATISAQAQYVTPQWFFQGPHLYPHHPFPFPFPHPHHPPPAPGTTTDTVIDEEKRCFEAVHSPAMKACLGDLHSYIMTRQIKVGSTCCAAIENIVDVCQPLVDHPFTFLENIITHHCSAPSPSN
ncbi:hypothetical protein RND81_04G117300 [Saponaria officinalis]|uniref:Prolamin-like domain-containing protein n=1 Tax=Saponaria officinalis TaxID=3572 RepID=A0AAW1LK14_SAPOF